MKNYILRRLLFSIPVLLALLLFTFLLIRLQPSGPFSATAAGFPIPETVRAALEHEYGLDLPLFQQYVRYVSQILQGNFGPMLRTPFLTVNDIIVSTLPVTLQLGAMSLLLGVLIGLPAGIYAAIHHNSRRDYFATLLAVVGMSVPTLAIAPFLVIFLGLRLGWFPIAFWAADPPFFLGLFPNLTPEFFDHAVLPVVTIGIGISAGIARLTRGSLLEELTEDYIRTARAKGLVERMVIFRHALKNALIPVVTLIGPMLVTILPGVIVVENIFAINGLGRNMIEAIRNREYFLLSSSILVFSLVIILGNLLADIAYAWLDPRIHYESE
ncbi:MAG: ABC transporter permease [Anaerolineales bacterium]